MKIGIVGGTGNISLSIVRLLLTQGHEVVCFNRGKTAKLPEGTRLIQGDRRNREDFECKMQAEKFDAAIDIICFNSDDAASSVRAFRGVGWFIQTSTVCTYGIKYDYFPSDETHPFRPIPDFAICEEIFAHHVYYSSEKLFRDVPEFRPQISIEQGMAQVFEAMEREGRIPNSDEITWEDSIIAKQNRILI